MRFLISLLVFVAACTPRPKTPADIPGEGAVVAKVGDSMITDKVLMERVSAIEKSFPRTYATHIQKKNLLTEMMNTELLYREALKLGLDKKYEFKSRLADLYVRELSEKARSEISDKQIKNFFEEVRADVEQISARHILLKTASAPTTKEKAALKAKIEEYRSTLLKKPSEFPSFAQKYSEDGSKDSGGELGFFSRGMMVKPFSDAAFNLKHVGDISPVIESQFGYHIIQLTGDRRGFEPYKELIREQFLRKTQKTRLEEELARLKSGKEFQIFEESLLKLSPLPSEIVSNPKDLIPEGAVVNDKPSK